MSEENKTVEFNDDELEQVSGGTVSEINNSIINKWYKKSESSDKDVYFCPVEIHNNEYINGMKFIYTISSGSYIGSYANMDITEFSVYFTLSERPSWWD